MQLNLKRLDDPIYTETAFNDLATMDSHMPPSDRFLRQICIFAFLPALALLIPYGVTFHKIVPTLGLLPSFLTVVFSTIAIMKDVRSSFITLFVDFFQALFLIGILIPGFVVTTDSWDVRGAELASYASVPLMVQFVIHSFFVLRELPSVFRHQRRQECPHCHNEISTTRLPTFQRRGPRPLPSHFGSSKEVYNSVPGAEYEDARQSVGDYATSGFPTPRVSAETLDSNVESLSLV